MSPAVLYAWEKKWQLARHSSTYGKQRPARARGWPQETVAGGGCANGRRGRMIYKGTCRHGCSKQVISERTSSRSKCVVQRTQLQRVDRRSVASWLDLENLSNQHGEKATVCPHPVSPTSHAPFRARRLLSIGTVDIHPSQQHVWRYNRIHWT